MISNGFILSTILDNLHSSCDLHIHFAPYKNKVLFQPDVSGNKQNYSGTEFYGFSM